MKMKDHRKSVAIVGCGAAGMMAAAAVAESTDGEVSVHVFEKNAKAGRKVAISGGGRCNVTTGIPDVRQVLKNYPRGSKFVMSAMFRFPPQKVMEWFEARGVKLKVEDDLRVFPVSEKGEELVDAVCVHLKRLGVDLRFNTAVSAVKKEEDGFILTLKDGGVFNTDVLIVTTGGNAYAGTGSTGDGYSFAKSLGHSLTPMAPSLGGFVFSDSGMEDVAGVSIEKVGLKLTGRDGKVFNRTGPLVFTHAGISGPAVFALQSMAAYVKMSENEPVELTLDLFPEENPEEFKKRLQATIEKNGKKSVRNMLDILMPKSLCGFVLRLTGIAGEGICGNLSKEQRKHLAVAMKGLMFHVTGTCSGDEFVTAGGVSSDEINSSTMESKICSGLYLAGEILDVDGFTGGFNLQAAWATGRLAGESAVEKLIKAVR